MGGRGRAWVWMRRLLAWEEESVWECSSVLNDIVFQDHVHDRWKWLLDPIHGYSVRGTYHFLTAYDESLVRGRSHQVWHKYIPSKVSVFAWRLLRDRLPTKANLARQPVLQSNDTMCVGGCGVSETADHLFLACDIFGSVWNMLWLDISHVVAGEIGEHFIQFTHLARMHRSSHPFFKVIWLACVGNLEREE